MDNGNFRAVVRVQDATLYFSDISDFVDLTVDSEPMELVSLLNGIYGLIDSQIDAYDVYKVSQSINIGLMKGMSERMPLTKIHELDLSTI